MTICCDLLFVSSELNAIRHSHRHILMISNHPLPRQNNVYIFTMHCIGISSVYHITNKVIDEILKGG